MGENVVTSGDSTQLGAACNAAVPTNCPSGKWIDFKDTGECVCIAWCSDFKNVGLGDNCNKDGSWQCLKIKASNANANSATACVPVKWNLCTEGGGGDSGGGDGGGDSGAGTPDGGDAGSGTPGAGDSGGGQCLPSGESCDDDSECCSGSCFITCEEV